MSIAASGHVNTTLAVNYFPVTPATPHADARQMGKWLCSCRDLKGLLGEYKPFWLCVVDDFGNLVRVES